MSYLRNHQASRRQEGILQKLKLYRSIDIDSNSVFLRDEGGTINPLLIMHGDLVWLCTIVTSIRA
jgi:hypothetical protein